MTRRHGLDDRPARTSATPTTISPTGTAKRATPVNQPNNSSMPRPSGPATPK